MKLDRIMWGIVLLFIGGVLLLQNFDIINFYWGSIWRFWPIFLIIAGVNILFSKNKSQLGGILSIAILVVTLSFLFYKGQKPKVSSLRTTEVFGDDEDNFDQERLENLSFSSPYVNSAGGKTILNISGGGTSFSLKDATDSLVSADVIKRGGTFTLKTSQQDSLTTVDFKMKGNSKWSISDGGNDAKLKLNVNPVWEINMNMGAGEVGFDLSAFKVRTFNFDGGAAALNIKFGDKLPITDINVKTGVAEVKINVPSTSGCRVNTKTGLSTKDFEGFIKLKNGAYETPNYAESTKKIFINLDGGLSSFEVKRY